MRDTNEIERDLQGDHQYTLERGLPVVFVVRNDDEGDFVARYAYRVAADASFAGVPCDVIGDNDGIIVAPFSNLLDRFRA